LQMFAGALMRRGRCCPWRLVVTKDSVTETVGVGPQDRAACPHDLVLLDLCLPDRDGEEVQGAASPVREVSARSAATPVRSSPVRDTWAAAAAACPDDGEEAWLSERRGPWAVGSWPPGRGGGRR
jgi:hypothetical protein